MKRGLPTKKFAKKLFSLKTTTFAKIDAQRNEPKTLKKANFSFSLVILGDKIS